MKTLVIGASENPERYSNKAIVSLLNYHHEVEAIGLKTGEVNGVKFKTGFPDLEKIDTVTLYIGPKHQPAYYEYLMKMKPRRIIFNPGTENTELIELAQSHGIQTEIACTLVLLAAQAF